MSSDIRVRRRLHKAVIFDVLYGFIPITACEEKIINSPFFQRLRWIKQLGFSNYIFPGAEHNRFAHVIGVMHSMHEMVRGLGIHVSDDELFDPHSRSPQAMLHKSLRIAALLHDLGTFPLSHAVEYAYIRKGTPASRKRKSIGGSTKSVKNLTDNHEHLGAFIIKNTRYPGGITQILEDYGFDVQMISNIIKGDSPHFIANQLMHSDLDADRMDYLLRDSHYTGIQYGKFDRSYLMANLETYQLPGGQLAFGVRENAQHAIEDFLIARFSWYSQVIKNPGSAKFDVLSTHLASGMLELGALPEFPDLLTMVERGDERFFWWNDLLFMQKLQECHFNLSFKKKLDSHWLQEICEMLLYRKAPKTIRIPEFEHQILLDDGETRSRRLKTLQDRLAELRHFIKKYGNETHWILADVPQKDVYFTKRIKAGKSIDRDSVKIVDSQGNPHLLYERKNSLMQHLHKYMNFVPSVYTSASTMELLKHPKSPLAKVLKRSNKPKRSKT